MMRLLVILGAFIVFSRNVLAFTAQSSTMKLPIMKRSSRWTTQPRSTVIRRLADEDDVAATEKEEQEIAMEVEVAATSVNVLTGETPVWVDNAAGANVQWYNLSWWGYLILVYPAVLFADDVFHFLPEGGIVGLYNSIKGE
mmetsp:Transcript_76718/g.153957  ORF Transcript_76718/g.153957 Transcript_76718/m.153957 type:complete len:141 (-) Transcript_76718:75-497(-)